MPGGNDNEVNALYAIACSTGEMATAAGGVPVANYGDNEDSLAMAIACNLYATLGGLGSDCQPTWVDGATAWQAILQMSAALVGLTGAGDAVGFYELPQQGVFCNLLQVSTNTGTTAEGDFGGNEGDLALLNSIACVTAQIAANGFTPPPPAPTGLNAIANYSAVNLSWFGTFVDNYKVYRATVSGGPYTLIGSPVSFSFNDLTVTDWIPYFYVVTAVVGGQESAYSIEKSATPERRPEGLYDASALTPGAITAWPEKNLIVARNLSGTATVLAAAQNGLNAVDFNGSTHQLAATLTTPTQRTVIMALRTANLNNANPAINFGSGVTSNLNGILRRTTGDWAFATPGTGVPVNYGVLTDPPGVLAWVYDGPGNVVRLYKNGVFVTGTTHNASNAGVSATLRLGSATGAANFKVCTWFELIVYDAIIPDSAIALKSAQLQAKWALP